MPYWVRSCHYISIEFGWSQALCEVWPLCSSQFLCNISFLSSFSLLGLVKCPPTHVQLSIQQMIQNTSVQISWVLLFRVFFSPWLRPRNSLHQFSGTPVSAPSVQWDCWDLARFHCATVQKGPPGPKSRQSRGSHSSLALFQELKFCTAYCLKFTLSYIFPEF